MATFGADLDQPLTATLPRMTRHAAERHQQRAVPTLVTSLILAYGTTVRRAGSDVFYLNKKARKHLRRDFGGERNLRALQPFFDIYVVVGDDGELITAGRRQRRIKTP